MPLRTVIYARFSSDNQNPRSIADQVALCRDRADREGWPVVAVFEDAATSGAAGMGEDQRPGLHAMLQLVDHGGVDQVLAESTDRVSRHVSDAHLIRERIEFAGARLFTLFDGTVTPMIGLIKGFTDAQFRSDLAARVKRGQRSAIAQGRSAGALSYGYRRVNAFDAKGNLIRGLREIDPETAAIVRRIFTEYAAGLSSWHIAGRLNGEGIRTSRRGYWQASSILGTERAGSGILRNRLYIGELVFGRLKNLTNPQTRRVIYRPNDTEALTVHPVPHLRIIDDATWEAVRVRLAEKAFKRPDRARRPKHLLSGLGECAVCGGAWTKTGGDNWGCARYRNGNSCSNNRMINSRRYQAKVLADLKDMMLAPDAVAEYVREYHRDFARKVAQLGRDRKRLERQLGEQSRKVDRLVTAFAEGGSEFAEIRNVLTSARDERDRLTRELASLEAVPVLLLHPGLADDYRREVEALEDALTGNDDQKLETIPRIRAMIARIIVRPSAKLRGVEIEVVRQFDEVLALATGTPGRTARG